MDYDALACCSNVHVASDEGDKRINDVMKMITIMVMKTTTRMMMMEMMMMTMVMMVMTIIMIRLMVDFGPFFVDSASRKCGLKDHAVDFETWS